MRTGGKEQLNILFVRYRPTVPYSGSATQCWCWISDWDVCRAPRAPRAMHHAIEAGHGSWSSVVFTPNKTIGKLTLPLSDFVLRSDSGRQPRRVQTFSCISRWWKCHDWQQGSELLSIVSLPERQSTWIRTGAKRAKSFLLNITSAGVYNADDVEQLNIEYM